MLLKKTMAFSFGFGGDDIDVSNDADTQPSISAPSQASKAGAFPVAGKPQLPATHHDLDSLISHLPSKVAYDTLDVTLDDGTTVSLPRRELWDVRVQLMAEDESEEGVDADGSGLGSHDVKTGVYEGGFKSWESSVDLVKVLAAQGKQSATEEVPTKVIEVSRPSHAFQSRKRNVKVDNACNVARMRHSIAIPSPFPMGNGRSPTKPMHLHRSRLQPNRAAAGHPAQLHTRLGSVTTGKGPGPQRSLLNGRGAGATTRRHRCIQGAPRQQQHYAIIPVGRVVRRLCEPALRPARRRLQRSNASSRRRDHLLPLCPASLYRNHL